MSPTELPDLSTLARWPTLIVLGLCSFAGLALKAIPPQHFRNWLIPFCVGGIGGIVGWALLSPDLNGLMLGILLGGISVYGHQLVTQFLNREPAKVAPLVAACLLASSVFLVGCGGNDASAVQTVPPSAGTVGQKVEDKAQAFWDAMKGDLGAAKTFLSSDVARKNAPIFARAMWRLGLAGANAAGVDLKPVAQVGVPVCDVVLGLTGSATAITSSQIDAVIAGTGSKDSLAAYNPFLSLAGPVLDWIVAACGTDMEGVLLAKFYLGLIASEGKLALAPYLPGAHLLPRDRYVEEWAEEPRLA